MKYYTIPPPPDLADCVRFFWVLESDAPYCHRSMADGCSEVVFHYKGRFDEVTNDKAGIPSFVSGLHGPSEQHRRYTTNSAFGIFGVYLYPFSLADLFAIPAGELANHVIPLESLPGNDGKALGEQMLHALNNRERMIIMINFFRSRMNRSQFNQGACLSVIRQMVHAGSLLRVDQLAKESFLSFRQFERNFKQLTGFSPKKYSRILRFQSATRLYGNKGKNLTDIAHECGYYDQSHFIHEFKQFSGYHPKQYFSGRSEAVAWKEANKQN